MLQSQCCNCCNRDRSSLVRFLQFPKDSCSPVQPKSLVMLETKASASPHTAAKLSAIGWHISPVLLTVFFNSPSILLNFWRFMHSEKKLFPFCVICRTCKNDPIFSLLKHFESLVDLHGNFLCVSQGCNLLQCPACEAEKLCPAFLREVFRCDFPENHCIHHANLLFFQA